MKNNTVNKSASVKALLKNKAKKENKPYSEILQYYGIERFLYRFSQSKYADKFVLKGALLFTVWDLVERRSTRDIDFLAVFDNNLKEVEKFVKEICCKKFDDGIIFDEKSVRGERIKEDADYEGVRIKFEGFIEKTKITIQIDFGFGDIIYPKPKKIKYPAILDQKNTELNGYTMESVVAEKFEAMVKLNILNSRMKDFYDIWLLSKKFIFNGKNLANAIKKTFTNRKTELPDKNRLFAEEMYDKESDMQIFWNAFVNKNEIKNISKEFPVVLEQIERFLSPPVKAVKKKEVFNKMWRDFYNWR